jgi:TolC family type I secretion outer membrane protein
MKHQWRRGVLFPWLSFFIFILLTWPAWAQQEEIPSQGKPITLEQCTAMALKYHPSLHANRATIEGSKARVEQTLSAYYPQVNLNALFTNSSANYNASGRIGSNAWTFYDFYSVGPTLTQNIYDFGRTANSVAANRENVKASEQDLTTTKQLVVLNVKQAYFSVLQTQRLIQVAEDTVKQMQDHLAQAQGFYQAGTRPKIDVTKAGVDLANAQLALVQARNNYQVAQVTLNNALGLRQELTFPIDDILGFKPTEISREEILNAAYEQRPELLQLKAKQRAQEATVRLADSSYYPTLSGNASYLYRGNQVENLYWDLFVGATLNIPLFSGFSSPNQVAEARANLRNLQAQEENLKLNIRLEAEQAFLGLKEADERIRVTEKAVGHAQENFELANGRYQVGVGFPLEVTDAEVLLANARANYIQALYDYKVSEARIEKAMGINR